MSDMHGYIKQRIEEAMGPDFVLLSDSEKAERLRPVLREAEAMDEAASQVRSAIDALIARGMSKTDACAEFRRMVSEWADEGSTV